jgi:Peptide methionine sulfoxide reductase
MGKAFSQCFCELTPSQAGANGQTPTNDPASGRGLPAAAAASAIDLRKAASPDANKNSDENAIGKCAFGAGCYWGTEKFLKIEFPKKTAAPWRKHAPGSIVKGEVGFMGPKNAPPNPSYKDVCSGMTDTSLAGCMLTGCRLC